MNHAAVKVALRKLYSNILLIATLSLLQILSGVSGPARADAPPERADENFSGQGGRGPYFLAWKGLTPGSERVYRNGDRLYRTTDYNLDYATGVLTFEIPLSPMDTLEVDYPAANAQPNAVGTVAPTINLFNTDSTHVNATYSLGRQSDINPLGKISTVGLGADSAGKNWKLNSNLLMATQGSGFEDRSGLHLAGQYGLGALQFSGDFARTGDALDPQGQNGLQKNQQAMVFGLLYKPSDRFHFSTQYRTTDDLKQKGVEKSVTTEEIGFKPTGRTTLLATRMTENTLTGDQTGTVQTDTLHVEQQVVKNASAIAEYQTVSGKDTQSDTSRLGVSTSIFPGLKVETTAYQTRIHGDPAKTGEETGVQAKVVTDVKSLQVNTLVDQKQTDTTSQSTAGVEVASKGGTVKVQGEVGRNSDAEFDQNHMKAVVTLNPFKPLIFTANYLQTEQIQKTEGAESDANTAPATTQDQQYGITYKPGDALTLSADRRAISANGADTNVTALSASLKPVSFLQVSGAYKLRDATAQDAALLDTQDAQVAIQMSKRVKLTGGYTANPEQDGQVIQAIRKSVGMETSLGFLLLSGGYSTDDRTGDAGSNTTELGLGFNLSASTQLKATYKLVDGFGVGFGDQTVFGLQYSRNLGDRFNLSFQGEAANSQDYGADLNHQYKGTAKLGMRF